MNNIKQIEEVIKEQGMLVCTTAGTSMYPMLRDRRDTIIVKPYEGRLKKYDVPLYKSGTRYILHRIVEVCPDSYVICGDNCERKEYGITDEQILGVLTGFYRGSKLIDMNSWQYKLYARIACAAFPLRRVRGIARSIARRIWHVFKKGEK
ncbi:MAG: S24/S26 family peptidase [Tyzzerella sp.]|nr:S24/S26 family peptidase [Tyzzerella sp.]